MKVRRKSLDVWCENPDAKYFDEEMRKYLKQLKLATKIYHYVRATGRKVFNFLGLIK